MSFIYDLVYLLYSSFVLLGELRSQLAASLGSAIFITSVFMVGALNYYKLWNLSFRPTSKHIILCVTSGILTFLFIIILPCLNYTKPAADLIIGKWSVSAAANSDLRSRAHDLAFKEIRELGLEDPEGFKDRTTIPVNKQQSRSLLAKIYSDVFLTDFKSKHPFVSRVVWFSSSSDEAVRIALQDKVINYFDNVSKTLPNTETAGFTAEILKRAFSENSDRIIPIARIILILIFMAFQILTFGIIGWDAWRDLKITI